MTGRLLILAAVFAASALAADPALAAQGEKEAARNCIACHSLRIVQSQRLSRAAWNRELDKMAGWGTTVGGRDALLEYLVANFGDDKPAQPPPMTQDATSSPR